MMQKFSDVDILCEAGVSREIDLLKLLKAKLRRLHIQSYPFIWAFGANVKV
jgi:hypothetical protein